MGKEKPAMAVQNTRGLVTKAVIVLLLFMGVGAALYFKDNSGPAIAVTTAPGEASSAEASPQDATAALVPEPDKPIPRLVDLGADKCIPCKMMAPMLAELREEYAGRMGVEFIDVWKNPNAGREYGIRVIPTQIFYDAEGKELFRHEGFYGKEDILAKWEALGISF